VFAGGVFIIAGIVLFLEKRRIDDDILKIRPFEVLRNILINQIGFYVLYLLLAFTVDITGNEVFWWTQVFAGVEFSFVTKRGLLTALSLILSLAASSIPATATVRTYRNMLDYSFTVFVIHFIVVSIVEGQFPAYGAWWVANGVGLILFMTLAERLSYHLETMSYQSSLHGKTKSSNVTTEEPSLDSGEYLSSASQLDSQKESDLEKGEKKTKQDSSVEGGDSSSDDSNSKEEKIQREADGTKLPSSKKSSKSSLENSSGKSDSGKNSGNNSSKGSLRSEEEKKSSLRKRKLEEEKRMKEGGNGKEVEEESKSSYGTKLSGGSSKSNSSGKLQRRKSHQLKEEETGKKDSLRAAKKREVPKDPVSAEDAVELEDVKESPPHRSKTLQASSEQDSDQSGKETST